MISFKLVSYKKKKMAGLKDISNISWIWLSALLLSECNFKELHEMTSFDKSRRVISLQSGYIKEVNNPAIKKPYKIWKMQPDVKLRNATEEL